VALADRPAHEPPRADAAVTRRRGLLLAVRVADCLPVLLADDGGRAAAVVHAGWRGVAAGVVEESVRTLCREAAVDPAELVAAVGPGIGICCFEVDGGVAEAVAPDRRDLVRPGRRGRPHLDLRGAVVSRLVDRGLPRERIDDEAPCTSCRNDLLFSYRKEKDAAGRLVAAIGYALSMT
jgi:YfiH family protein